MKIINKKYKYLLVIWGMVSGLCIGAGMVHGASQQVFRPFVFVQMADPQIGSGEGSLVTAWNLKKQAREINALDPAFGFVIGNLTWGTDFWHHYFLDGALAAIEPPLFFVPGVADVSNGAGLARFRRQYGEDYYLHIYNNCAFIALNAATLLEPTVLPLEYHRQWQWLESVLAATARDKRTHIVLLIHRPSHFMHAQKHGQVARLRELINQYGVATVVSGMTKHKAEFRLGNAQVYALNRSIGEDTYNYRVFRVYADRIEPQVAKTEPSVGFPPASKGWLPQILNPRVRDQIKMAVFLGAFLLSWQAGRRCWDGHNKASGQMQSGIWRFIAALFLLYLLNATLHLNGLMTLMGRWIIDVHSAEYQHRAWVQGLILGLAGCSLLVAFWRMGFKKRHVMNWQLWIALGCACGIACLFVLVSVSWHDSDVWLYRNAWVWYSDFSLVEIMACLAMVAALFNRNPDHMI